VTIKKKKVIFLISFLFLIFSYSFVVFKSLYPSLPKPGDYPVFYSNRAHQNLKYTIVKAIKGAKSSLFLVSFGLSDLSIIANLEKKAQKNLNMRIFYDKRSSPDIDLSNKQAFPIKTTGLLHQKILVVDNKLVFLGSANFTKSSLLMHDNLIIGFYSPDMAKFILSTAPFSSGYHKSLVGGQQVELFLLPDKQNKAISKLRKLIRSSTRSIKVAMFTLTHPILIDELVKAKKRHIDVKVYIDQTSGSGASKKAIERLKNAHITTKLCKSNKLFHHKYICIDDNMLICGSANWTKSAFEKNYDLFFILYNLSKPQSKQLNALWKYASLETS
jgi:cardiolipin synthase A/B